MTVATRRPRRTAREGRRPHAAAVAIAIAILLLAVAPAVAQEIGILRSMRADAFEEAVTAFKTGLLQAFPDATFTDLGVVVPGWRRQLARFHGAAVLAVGSLALDSLLTEGGDRPIGFTMVLRPRPPVGKRVAGAAMEAAIDEEVALIHRVLPAISRMAGLILRGEPHDWATQAARAVRDRGLTWQLVNAESIDALPDVVHRAAPFDLLLLPPEPDLLTPRAFRVLVRLARREAFGLAAPSTPFVRAGAAAAVEVSWAESGRLAATQMAHLLRNERPAAAVLHPRPVRLWLHQQRLHDLRWAPQPGPRSPLIHLWEGR